MIVQKLGSTLTQDRPMVAGPPAPPAVPPAAPQDAVQVSPAATPHSPRPAAPAPATQRSEGVLTPWLQRAAGAAFGTCGAIAGAAIGGAVGVVAGGVMGATAGFLGAPTRYSHILHPMENVAGLAGVPAHAAAEKVVGKYAGARAGKIAGEGVGLVAGAASGAVIGALGVAWAGLDAGARIGARAASHLFGDAPAAPRRSDKPTYEQGILSKQIPTPDGVINKKSHHWFYINHGVEVLKNDAKSDPKLQKIYDFLTADADNLKIMHNGAWNMDSFQGDLMEGISPATFDHFGEAFMPGFKRADWQCRQAYDKAADAWMAGDRKQAIYYLGAAMHLPQDLSLPQHSVTGVSYVGKMAGHQMMETYMETHFDQAVIDHGGTYYPDVDTPEAFCARVQNEAKAQYGDAVKEAWKYLGWTKDNGVTDPMNPPDQASGGPQFPMEVYKAAGQRAQRITPGFIELFFRDMEKRGYPI